MVYQGKMAKKLPKDAAKYDMKPYKRSVYMVTSRDDLATCEKYMNHPVWDSSKAAGAMLYMESKFSSGIYFIGVFDGKITTLAHECSHAILELFLRQGLMAHDSQGEAFCYLLEDMLKTFIPLLKKSKKKSKPAT